MRNCQRAREPRPLGAREHKPGLHVPIINETRKVCNTGNCSICFLLCLLSNYQLIGAPKCLKLELGNKKPGVEGMKSNKRRKKHSCRRKGLSISCSSLRYTHILWLPNLEWLMISLPRRMRCSYKNRALERRSMLTREQQEFISLVSLMKTEKDLMTLMITTEMK